jgi:hypothetical protein
MCESIQYCSDEGSWHVTQPGMRFLKYGGVAETMRPTRMRYDCLDGYGRQHNNESKQSAHWSDTSDVITSTFRPKLPLWSAFRPFRCRLVTRPPHADALKLGRKEENAEKLG